MVKKRRGRGESSRGNGNKSGRGGSRGGYLGAKHSRRNNRKKSHYGPQPPSTDREFPELEDLSANSNFVSINNPERSLRAAAKRTKQNNALQREAFRTEDNRENTMRLPLRKRPVEFVKASMYDPSADLFKIIGRNEIQEKTKETDLKLSKNVAIAVEHIVDTPTDSIDTNAIRGELQDDQIVDHHSSYDEVEPINDEKLFFVDDQGDNTIKERLVDFSASPSPSEMQKKKKTTYSSQNTEFDGELSIGKVLLPVEQKKDGTFVTHVPSTKNLKEKELDIDDSLYDYGSDSSFEEIQGTSRNLHASYHRYIENVLQNVLGSSDKDDQDDPEADREFGDLQIEMEDLEEDGEEETRFIAEAYEDEEGQNDSDDSEKLPNLQCEDDTIEELKRLNLESNNHPTLAIPKYGFLPEDYETFDISTVNIAKIRFGYQTNQYFVKCFQFLGNYDYNWLEHEVFTELLSENGMPEHRIPAYLEYVCDQLRVADPESQPDYLDVPLSDSEDDYEESHGDVLSDFSSEGLDDLIKFTQKYDGIRDAEYEPTHTLTTTGTGKKKRLHLSADLDEELCRTLNEKFETRKEAKKRKKESSIDKKHQNSNDLSLKYPYSFHIKDIRDEFESFYTDHKRNSLVFPPMDPHGIKTLSKIAYYFNMKSRKFGQGLKQHAVIIKNKRTHRVSPDYHSVGLLLKQRRVFNRIDQRRPRSEKEKEESLHSRRGNPSKAHVKDGDVVGADAPEISSNNVGRKLLEKLGWKSGQGLGAENKGIPEPVVATVKKSRLGLR